MAARPVLPRDRESLLSNTSVRMPVSNPPQSGKSCAWNLLGLMQVTLQWFLFSILYGLRARTSPPPRAADKNLTRLVLYLIYFPVHLKYCRTLPLPATDSNDALLASDRPTEDPAPTTNTSHERTPLLLTPSAAGSAGGGGVKYTTTPAWNLATLLAWFIFLHLTLLTLLAIALLHFLPPVHHRRPGAGPLHPLVTTYARFLGTSSALLAITQYAPQLVRTYRARLVGALSIGTMLIQVPGSILFVASLVGRQGVEWSTWASYAVTGGMQAALLGMCLAWKRRQKRLRVDDFGVPFEAAHPVSRERG